jgi:phage-related protein
VKVVGDNFNHRQKKTQRTPKKEIKMALKIKAEYESEIRSIYEFKSKE